MKTNKYIYVTLIHLIILGFCSCNKDAINIIDLSGKWSFKIDTENIGIAENWHLSKLKETIELPGSMASNNKGNNVSIDTDWTGNMWNDSLWYKDPQMQKYRQKGNIKIPFWLTPKKVYKGAAWYQKEVFIPKEWEDKQVELFLERVHWESTVWINGQKIGSQNSLATSHNYIFLNKLLKGKNTITIRVDNRIKDINVGLDAHSISDNTQTNWNGIIGDIKLIARPKVTINDVSIKPNIAKNIATVKFKILGSKDEDEKVFVKLVAKEKSLNGNTLQSIQKEFRVNSGKEIALDYKMGKDVKLWDEFHPNLYQLEITLTSSKGTDVKNIDFGMREINTKDNVFTINNRPIFLRGTLECAIFPLTGFPPTDVASWKRIYKIIKQHGLNHMRFHSWCPPKAAFIAADEEGVYLQIEASAWTKIGDGKPIDKWLYLEGESIIKAYGNHPSFILMAYGNEPSGKNYKNYLKKYVSHFKKIDNRRLYTSAAGWTFFKEMDYFNNFQARIQKWNENLNSIINAKPPQTNFDWKRFINNTPMPYVSHEIGQWCVFPNFKEMAKYTGVLQPKNFEIFKETLTENDLGHLSNQFLMASGKLQTICYKADIEAALRTKNMAGFQLLDLHDFPGQGTALVGVLDAFWDEKGYVSPAEFKAFSGQTVPLARLEKRIFYNSENLKATIEVAHFGEKQLKEVTPKWQLKYKNDSVFAEGKLPKKSIVIGNGIQLGKLNIPLQKIEKAKKLTLCVTIKDYSNTWDIWVYPKQNTSVKSKNLKIVEKLDKKTIHFLENGGNVLLNINKGDINSESGGKIGIGFSSIFWNTSWTNGQKPHTLGILCDPNNPALADFPTEYHSNWQWWDAMSNSNAIILTQFKNIKPIVRVVDDWFKNRSLGLLFEVKIGKGNLLFSGIDLHSNLEKRPEAKQLLFSLTNYINSKDFRPKYSLKVESIKKLLKYKI